MNCTTGSRNSCGWVRLPSWWTSQAACFCEAPQRCPLRTSCCSRPRPARFCAETMARWPNSSSECPRSPPCRPTCGSQRSRRHPLRASPSLPARGCCLPTGWAGSRRTAGSTSLTLRGRERPPAPWSNVLANPGFGSLITEAGAGYTWAGNAQMNRLTPWSNDPVADPPGEALYLRDEETGEFWSPDAGPLRRRSDDGRPSRAGLYPLHQRPATDWIKTSSSSSPLSIRSS